MDKNKKIVKDLITIVGMLTLLFFVYLFFSMMTSKIIILLGVYPSVANPISFIGMFIIFAVSTVITLVKHDLV
jgi:hypothetical protein